MFKIDKSNNKKKRSFYEKIKKYIYLLSRKVKKGYYKYSRTNS